MVSLNTWEFKGSGADTEHGFLGADIWVEDLTKIMQQAKIVHV
jgi:hypothetical protein